MIWAVTGLLTAVVLVLSIVNATRIERIRSDVDNSSGGAAFPETESMLIRGESGKRIPKKAYWVNVHPDPNPSSDKEELSIDKTGQDTDGAQLENDVLSQRVRYVYRADQRALFAITKEGSKLHVTPVASGSTAVRFVAPGTSGPSKMTIIGLPEALVTATASSV